MTLEVMLAASEVRGLYIKSHIMSALEYLPLHLLHILESPHGLNSSGGGSSGGPEPCNHMLTMAHLWHLEVMDDRSACALSTQPRSLTCQRHMMSTLQRMNWVFVLGISAEFQLVEMSIPTSMMVEVATLERMAMLWMSVAVNGGWYVSL